MKNDLPGLVECRMQPSPLTEKHSGVFLSGTKWAPTTCQKPMTAVWRGPVCQGSQAWIAVLCHTTVTDCLGTERGKFHLTIAPPASGTAEDAPGISVSSIPLGKQDTVSSSVPAVPAAGRVPCSPSQNRWQSRECSGSSTCPSQCQLLWDPPFPGAEKAWRRE